MPLTFTDQLRLRRGQKSAPVPPSSTFMDDTSYGDPIPIQRSGYHQEVAAGAAGGGMFGFLKSGYMYIVFTFLPMLITAAILYFLKPACVMDEKTKQLDTTKVLLYSALVGILGFLLKFFLFSS